jgi:hypothetical protein
MKVELLYIAGCPNHQEAARTLREILREARGSYEVSELEVTDAAQAQALEFIGSPSIRIEGRDIEPMVTEQLQYGLACRTYLSNGKQTGLPPNGLIRTAIRAALSLDHSESNDR